MFQFVDIVLFLTLKKVDSPELSIFHSPKGNRALMCVMGEVECWCNYGVPMCGALGAGLQADATQMGRTPALPTPRCVAKSQKPNNEQSG